MWSLNNMGTFRVAVALFVGASRWVSDKILSRSLSRVIKKKIPLRKTVSVAWMAAYYFMVVLFGFFAFSNWMFDSASNPCLVYTTPKPWLESYYTVQLCFYVVAIFWLFLIDVPREDYMVELAHHGITIFLIIFSYVQQRMLIGATILWLHDISDVFLYSGKLLNYLLIHTKTSPHSWKTHVGRSLSQLLLIAFAISFCVCRLYAFGWNIVLGSCYEAFFYRASIPFDEDMGLYIGLWILLLIQLYYSWKIAQHVSKQLQHTEIIRDIRSDDEEDESLE